MAVNIEVSIVSAQAHPSSMRDIAEMHRSQGVSEELITDMLTADALPMVGFIAYHVTDRASTPVCAGFLREVEGGYGQLDTLVTNANLPGAIRHLGVSKVVDALIAQARKWELHGLICLTNDAGILKRAESLGFHVLNQTPIALKL